MRLNDIEISALNTALTHVTGVVYLFGSRVDDNAKGGDIDILVLSDENPYKTSQSIAVAFQMSCDEKIDVIVMNSLKMNNAEKAFFNSINKLRIK